MFGQLDQTDPSKMDKKERELLAMLYEVQEKMEPIIDGGKTDPDFIAMGRLVSRLEIYIQDKNQTLI
jgi:hypothetical protein